MNEIAPLERQLLIAGYILGDLSRSEGRLFEQMLAANPALWQEVAQLQRSLDLTYGTEVTPPPHLKAAVLTAAGQPAQQPAATVVTNRPHRRRTQQVTRWGFTRWASGLGVAAAALLIVALGVQNYTLRQALQATSMQQPSSETTFSLAPVESSQKGSVDFTVNPARADAVLKAEGLAPLPADQVYVLWTVVSENAPVTTDLKNAVLTAVFTVDSAGNQIQQIAVPSVFRGDEDAATPDFGLIKAIAVTIESAAAPQQHRSAPILIERL